MVAETSVGLNFSLFYREGRDKIHLEDINIFILYISAVQRSYVLGHNSLMPMEVRAPPHYYYYYYY
jgi:hypothetical protein